MQLIYYRIWAALAVVGFLSCPASAATLDFDCDVPANRFSSISAHIDGAPTIVGTVLAAELRSGDNLPVAGSRIVSADGAASLGFQLVAPSQRSSKFDIILNLNHNNDPQRKVVGQIDVTTAIPFRLSLATTGKVSLTIGDKRFDADFTPMSDSRAMIFCSTGQFKFTNLSFASGGM